MKTVAEIITEIKTASKGNTELKDLDTDKKSSVFGSIVATFASVVYGVEKSFEDLKKYIVDKIDTQKAGTAGWYILKLKQFQLGDQVNEFGLYDEVDESKRIITGAAVEPLSGELVLKVRKEGGLLSSDERDKLSDYIKDFKFAGVQTQLRNVPGDDVKIEIELSYNISITTEADVERNVKESLKKFFDDQDFNGELIVNKLVDTIQGVEGVETVHLPQNGVQVKRNGVSQYTLVEKRASPFAGYYNYVDSNVTIRTNGV